MTLLRPRPMEGASTRDEMVAPWRWFARTFGVAAVAHLVGNPAGWKGDDFGGSAFLVVASAALGAAALVLIVRPDRWSLGLSAALVLLTLWLELPVTGNHWVLVGIVAVAVLASLATSDPWMWLSVTCRWIFLAFYSFAAFAKLNTGFLDPSVSCGVFYANQSLASFGLPTFESDSLMSTLAIAGPVLTELSVPLLLAFSRTRRIGVLLALVFHSLISLDFDQHFYDFTAVLVMLLCLFLPERTTSGLEARASRPSRLGVTALALTVVATAASLMPPVAATIAVVRLLGFGVWVPVAVWLIVRVAGDGFGPSPLPMRLRGTPAWLLVAAVIANGLTPYLEVKTALGFNMYANLVTVAGESNHLVIRRTLHVSGVQDDLLEVVESTDPDLAVYAEDGYLVPERNLLDYLAAHPDSSVVVRDAAGERTLDGSDGVAVPLVVTKLLAFRAVDEQDPPRCQARWLPAR
jgi:hypothetical protein